MRWFWKGGWNGRKPAQREGEMLSQRAQGCPRLEIARGCLEVLAGGQVWLCSGGGVLTPWDCLWGLQQDGFGPRLDNGCQLRLWWQLLLAGPSLGSVFCRIARYSYDCCYFKSHANLHECTVFYKYEFQRENITILNQVALRGFNASLWLFSSGVQ